MIRFSVQMLLLVVVIGAVGGLAWRGAELVWSPVKIMPPQRTWSPATATNNQPPHVEHKALAAFTETLGRPLFFEGRRFPTKQMETSKPDPVVLPPPPRAITSPNQFRLIGIVQHGEERRALIEGPSVLLDWYMEGAKLQEWTLSRIENHGVFLSFEKQSAELRLFDGVDQN